MAIDTYNTQKHHFEEIFSTPAGSWSGTNPRFPRVRFAEAAASCAEDGHIVTQPYKRHVPNADAAQSCM